MVRNTHTFNLNYLYFDILGKFIFFFLNFVLLFTWFGFLHKFGLFFEYFCYWYSGFLFCSLFVICWIVFVFAEFFGVVVDFLPVQFSFFLHFLFVFPCFHIQINFINYVVLSYVILLFTHLRF